MTKKFGFTLAEVLITLGIIGVVAAMTIPTLIANTNSAKFKSGYKKAVSSLSQAALMGQAQWDTNYAGITSASSKTDERLSDGTASLTGLFNNTLAGVTIYSSAPTGYSFTGNLIKPMYAAMADGSMLIYSGSMVGCTRQEGSIVLDGYACLAYIDVNGVTAPNTIVHEGATAPTYVAYISGTTKVPTSTAIVNNDAAHMTDIYPVFLHDGVVEPATEAAKYVLTSK